MIWLIEMKAHNTRIQNHYLFDTNDINFNILDYEMSLYFASEMYFVFNESDSEEIYLLRFIGTDKNPERVLLYKDTDYYTEIRKYYINKSRDNKLSKLGI